MASVGFLFSLRRLLLVLGHGSVIAQPRQRSVTSRCGSNHPSLLRHSLACPITPDGKKEKTEETFLKQQQQQEHLLLIAEIINPGLQKSLYSCSSSLNLSHRVPHKIKMQ
ncbi:UNVERIFIED_CONTAM: hypothetical protein K2H54_057674 [Gekko kuhli]